MSLTKCLPRFHASPLLIALVYLLTLSDCPPPETPAATTDVTIPFDFRLDIPPDVTDFERTFTFYAGAPYTSFRFALRVYGSLPSGGKIEVLSPGASEPVDVITSAWDSDTRPLAGNVGLLRVTIPGRAAPPVIAVRALLATRPTQYTTLPAESPALAPRVTAFPLSPGVPVDMGFTTEETQHFFTAAGSEAETDVLLFGAGRLRVVYGESEWPRADDAPVWSVRRAAVRGTPGGFAFLRLRPNGRGLRIAVTNRPPGPAPAGPGPLLSGHARLYVLPVTGPQLLSFPSTAPVEYYPGVIGVDQDPAPGTLGPDGGALDCVNYAGVRGYVSVGSPAPGLPGVDLPGLPVCYDGHQGMDYPLVGWRLAQQKGVPVNAAAGGVVLATDSGHADNCAYDLLSGGVVCPDPSLPANYVAVRQDDGLFAYYFHLRTGSVLPRPGERVGCGERLGQAGSSGDSTGPHLHFELRRFSVEGGDTLNSFDLYRVRPRTQTVDPFADNTWRAVVAGVPLAGCG